MFKSFTSRLFSRRALLTLLLASVALYSVQRAISYGEIYLVYKQQVKTINALPTVLMDCRELDGSIKDTCDSNAVAKELILKSHDYIDLDLMLQNQSLFPSTSTMLNVSQGLEDLTFRFTAIKSGNTSMLHHFITKLSNHRESGLMFNLLYALFGALFFVILLSLFNAPMRQPAD